MFLPPFYFHEELDGLEAVQNYVQELAFSWTIHTVSHLYKFLY